MIVMDRQMSLYYKPIIQMETVMDIDRDRDLYKRVQYHDDIQGTIQIVMMEHSIYIREWVKPVIE